MERQSPTSPVFEWTTLISGTSNPAALFEIATAVFSSDMIEGEDKKKLVKNAFERFIRVAPYPISNLLSRASSVAVDNAQEFKLAAVDLIIARKIDEELREMIFLLDKLPKFLPADLLQKKITESKRAFELYSARGNFQTAVSGVIELK